ncbi:MAG: hypothetical protein GX964_10615 [Syntrophomonadaceae bacterium]|nr:hypothetical protein [Syntrophomonadaceae bacterium]
MFGAVFSFLAGIYTYITRSRIEEFLQTKRLFSKGSPFRQLGKKVYSLIGIDKEQIESILRLTGKYRHIDVDMYLGITVSVIACSIVLGVVLWIAGVFDSFIILILPLLFWGIPRAWLHSKANTNRTILRINVMDFCARLEQAVSGGTNPTRVFRWASEGNSLLANELKVVCDNIDLGVPLHQAFTEHFGDLLGVPEADDIGVILRNAERSGVPLSEALKELNRDFRYRRQDNLRVRSSKLKTTVNGILTVVVLMACIFLIVAPIAMMAFSSVGGL